MAAQLLRSSFIAGVIFLFGIVVTPAFATPTTTFSNLPGNINYQDEVAVDILFIGDPKYYKSKTYYLRGVFYQTDSNYCALTQNNNSEWIATASDPTKLFAFTTSQEGSWSGKLKIKYDSEETQCSGSGEYFFKIGRYTSSGLATDGWSSAQTLQIIAPTPTPTPEATSTPTPVSNSSSDNESTPAPTSTSISNLPSETPIGKIAGATTTTKKPKSASFPAELKLTLDTATDSASPGALLLTPSPELTINHQSLLPMISIYCGLGLTGLAVAWLLVRSYNKGLLWPWLKLPFS